MNSETRLIFPLEVVPKSGTMHAINGACSVDQNASSYVVKSHKPLGSRHAR